MMHAVRSFPLREAFASGRVPRIADGPRPWEFPFVTGLARSGVVVVFVALALAGCGRRGPLEAPPSAAVAKPPAPPMTVEERAQKADADAARRKAEQAKDPYGKDWEYPYRKPLIDVEPPDPTVPKKEKAVPHRSFFLDPLVN
jgi:predicted small lipoprotein YifL